MHHDSIISRLLHYVIESPQFINVVDEVEILNHF